jgi:hypothetical protein
LLILPSGFDKSGPSLYWIDYLGNMEKMKIGGHGKPLLRPWHSTIFVIAPQVTARTSVWRSWTGEAPVLAVSYMKARANIFGRYYKPDCSLDEAVELMAR